MIKEEEHLCGRRTYVHEIAGLTIRTDTIPLEADGALRLLLGGTPLYRVLWLGQRPDRFGNATPEVLAKLRTEPGSRPWVVQEHRCTAAEAPRRPSPASQAAADPHRPSAGHTEARSPERRTAPSSAPSAVTPRTDGPRCSECSQPCEDGTYASIAVGGLTLWAQHVTDCSAPAG